MNTYLDGVEYVGAIGRNIARGILPVATNFDADPANLAKATNDDPNDPTGIATTNIGAAGVFGNITLDFGSVKTAILSVIVDTWASASNPEIYICSSNDGVNFYYPLAPMGSSRQAAESIPISYPTVSFHARYLRLMYYNGAAANCYTKIYEIIALEVL